MKKTNKQITDIDYDAGVFSGNVDALFIALK